MNKIKKTEIKEVIKLLKKINYCPSGNNKSTLFFPIEEEYTTNSDGIELVNKSRNSGAVSYVKPGLCLEIVANEKEKKELKIFLGYAQTEYCPHIDMRQFVELSKSGFSEKEKTRIAELECLLVKNENLLAEYYI